MLIAIIGTIGFSGYLLFNFMVANQNERRIEDIRLVKFPIIEYIRRLEATTNAIRENLSNAIGLEDPFLIDEAQTRADEFLLSLTEIEALDTTLRPDISAIREDFNAYFSAAKAFSLSLIDAPTELYERTTDAEQINQHHEKLQTTLRKFLTSNIEQYSRSLFLADHSFRQANRWGVILGFVTIAILCGMAITISVTVVNAITRSDRLKEQFLATISHELRTPMNGIMGAITLLKTSQLNDGQKKLLEAASTSSGDMLIAVNDILEFSDILSGDFRIKESKWTLKSLLGGVIDNYRRECDKRNLIFRTDLPEENTTFLGDENRITHVLRHLMNNAIKFTPVGTVSLTVSLADMGPNKKAITFAISDTGPGVPEEYIAEMFNPFQQLDGSFKRQHGGLGIGLSICKRIADAFNGTLSFRNRDEGGATVNFSIPIKISKEVLELPPEQDVTLEPGANVKAKAKKGELISLTFETPLTVLVAEDNKVNQMIIKGYLQKLGCDVLTANHGQEAITLLENHDIDVILMDCQMPVMDGFEATQKIRQLRTHKATTPIIAVTANAMDADRERCFASGMNAYLKKPVEIGKLRRTIDEQVNPHKRRTIGSGD